MPGVEGTLMCMLVANGDSADNGRLDAMMKVRNRRGLELLRKIRDKLQILGRIRTLLLNLGESWTQVETAIEIFFDSVLAITGIETFFDFGLVLWLEVGLNAGKMGVGRAHVGALSAAHVP